MNENPMKHGVFSWNELMTPDVEAARSFYGALLAGRPRIIPAKG